jgi:dTMP kinase
VKGLFITFEGPDGAGKTTQILKMAKQLKNDGYDIDITREPGGTPISDTIRGILLSPDNEELVSQAEVLLYAASRAQHVHERILPALDAGKIVLCDRFIDASIAYQAFGLGIDEEMINTINTYASSGIKPDRTYIIDIPVEASRERILTRMRSASGDVGLDRIEQRELEYHRRVREGFLKIADRDTARVKLIDGNCSEDAVYQEILIDCKRLLNDLYHK